MTLQKIGRSILSLGMAGLGLFCILFHDFIIGRPPKWNEHMNDSISFGIVCGVMVILASLAMQMARQGAIAAGILAFMILILSVLRHALMYAGDWVNAFKALALLGGTLVMMGSFLHPDKKLLSLSISHNTARTLVLTGTILLASFFIAGGYAHFKWAEAVQFLIPEFIPFRLFWTKFCGICLFAGGIGILIPRTRYPAALLSGLMVLGWFFLLHIPRFISNPRDPSDQLGLFESFTFVGAFFVLAAWFKKD